MVQDNLRQSSMVLGKEHSGLYYLLKEPYYESQSLPQKPPMGGWRAPRALVAWDKVVMPTGLRVKVVEVQKYKLPTEDGRKWQMRFMPDRRYNSKPVVSIFLFFGGAKGQQGIDIHTSVEACMSEYDRIGWHIVERMSLQLQGENSDFHSYHLNHLEG
ncbi:hypothetical protein Cgig2_013427 [Carnegiea gigantea]|uniref:Uncharacterized protein n=1 Tax=Carnegiea gigantea TaxID=171969 RepID=A0A9Q1JZ42_9CARY|nr:hypothetical protein Cgig2_013427 [Carnegiea gigantea]